MGRFLFYSHDGCGLGHVRRNLAIAAALQEADPAASVLLATGSEEVIEDWLPPNVDTLKLPSLRKVANERYAPRRLSIAYSELRELRSFLLEAAVRSFRPTVLLADKHPLGASGELRRALDAVVSQGGRAVLGLRDVLDDPTQVREEWARDGIEATLAELFDAVLLFGQRTVLDPIREYGLGPAVAERLRYCGYVVRGPRTPVPARTRSGPDRGESTTPEILATAGGGEDGLRLLSTFVEAARHAQWRATVVAGPLCAPTDRELLRCRAEAAGVTFYAFEPELSTRLGEIDALVCMGGYNTLAEAVCRGTPTVCVPRVNPRREQLVRAQAFSSLGLLRLLEPGALSPERLGAEVGAVLQSPRRQLARRAHEVLDMDGAARAARELLGLASATPAMAA